MVTEVTSLNVRRKMSRVVVMGSSCSGKTSLARQISEKLGIDHTELDAIFWKPNWCPRSREEFRTLITEVVQQQVWLLDGNYSWVRDFVLPRATSLIWLNHPFRVVFWRALRRTNSRAISKEELFSGNRESFKRAFFCRESILWWVITTFRRRRRAYRDIFDGGEFPHLQVNELRTPAETEEFLKRLEDSVQQQLN